MGHDMTTRGLLRKKKDTNATHQREAHTTPAERQNSQLRDARGAGAGGQGRGAGGQAARRGYLGQYAGVGSRLPHERADARLALDLTERRLAALLLLLPPLRPLRPPRAGSAVAVSHSGNGPEIVGRPGTTPFFVLGFAFAFAPGATREPGPEGDAEGGADEEGEVEEPPKSHLKLKNPLSPRAFFGGGGDAHAHSPRAPRPRPPQSSS